MRKAARLTVSGLMVLASLSVFAPAALAAPTAIPLLVPPQLAADLSLGEAQPAPAPVLIAPNPLGQQDAERDTQLPSLPALAAATGLTHIGNNVATAGDKPTVVHAGQHFQCVTFARLMTGFDLFGDAKTWWTKARGLYEKMTSPRPGAVMVFAGDYRLRHGHVAVVKQVISAREVRVDHANWGNDGRVYLNTPVVDVSPNNDWSVVRVWNAQVHALGTHIYRLKGFLAG